MLFLFSFIFEHIIREVILKPWKDKSIICNIKIEGAEITQFNDALGLLDLDPTLCWKARKGSAPAVSPKMPSCCICHLEAELCCCFLASFLLGTWAWHHLPWGLSFGFVTFMGPCRSPKCYLTCMLSPEPLTHYFELVKPLLATSALKKEKRNIYLIGRHRERNRYTD